MKYILLAASCIILFAMPALAAEKYFALSAGTWLPAKTSTIDYNFRQIDTTYDAGWGIGGAFGVAIDNGLRLENELVYRQAKAKPANDTWTLGWLVNIWWDARNSSPVTPYFGGGFGFGRGHVASPGPVDNSGSGIAYQAGGGIDVRLDRRLSLDIGYRYYGLADLSSNRGVGSVDLTGSSIMAGIRYKF
jgi:opacity protein-like surface antigen